MPVIEARRASILVHHDHRHINQMRIFIPSLPMYKLSFPAGTLKIESAWGVCDN
jgi:hypothetical protein